MTGDPRAPTYKRLTERDSLYPLAAWARRHADALEPHIRRGLFKALASAWPSLGRRKKRYDAACFVVMLLDAGVSTKLIADRLGMSPKYVNELARDAAMAAEAIGDATRMEYCIDSEAVNDGITEPYDPATVVGTIWISAEAIRGDETDYWQRADEIAQELGYESLISMHETKAGHRHET